MPKTLPSSTSAVQTKTVSILGTLGLLALVSAGLAYGLLYAYIIYMSSSITAARDTLAKSEKQFEPELIAELTVLDKQMTISKTLMDKHVQISPILQMLNEKTLSSIQLDEMDYQLGDSKTVPVMKLKGQARSYRAIAQQSTVFSNDDRIREHVFSDFTVNETGRVEFQLKIVPSPDVIYFSKWYQTRMKDQALLPASLPSTPAAPEVVDNSRYVPAAESVAPATAGAIPITNTQSNVAVPNDAF